MRDTMDLSAQLTTLVQAIPGVIAVYPASTITAVVATLTGTLSATAAAIGTALNSVGGTTPGTGEGSGAPASAAPAVISGIAPVVTDARPDLVRIDGDGSGSHVAVHIGVDDAEPATDVCRRVHHAVAAYLAEISSESDAAAAVSSISVRVGRIG